MMNLFSHLGVNWNQMKPLASREPLGCHGSGLSQARSSRPLSLDCITRRWAQLPGSAKQLWRCSGTPPAPQTSALPVLSSSRSRSQAATQHTPVFDDAKWHLITLRVDILNRVNITDILAVALITQEDQYLSMSTMGLFFFFFVPPGKVI